MTAKSLSCIRFLKFRPQIQLHNSSINSFLASSWIHSLNRTHYFFTQMEKMEKMKSKTTFSATVLKTPSMTTMSQIMSYSAQWNNLNTPIVFAYFVTFNYTSCEVTITISSHKLFYRPNTKPTLLHRHADLPNQNPLTVNSCCSLNVQSAVQDSTMHLGHGVSYYITRRNTGIAPAF